jgi:hypothetical protein
MHPMVMKALAAEVERDHARQREELQLRSLVGKRGPGGRGFRPARSLPGSTLPVSIGGRGSPRAAKREICVEARVQMRYMMLVCVEPGVDLPAEELARIGPEVESWIEEMDGRGVRVEGHELAPVEAATTLRLHGGEVVLADGPFAETKEHVAGYDILECATIEEAVEVAARHPVARFGSIELRPFFEEGE